MTYNDTQFAELSTWEEAFITATRHSYARPLGRGAIESIAAIHREATGSRIKGDSSCAQCAMRVLRLVGTHWLADKDERAAAEVARAPKNHEVAVADKSPAKKKKTVKTRKNAK